MGIEDVRKCIDVLALRDRLIFKLATLRGYATGRDSGSSVEAPQRKFSKHPAAHLSRQTGYAEVEERISASGFNGWYRGGRFRTAGDLAGLAARWPVTSPVPQRPNIELGGLHFPRLLTQ